ncbi:MAG: hypothetical protein KAI79_08810, partial [Bacteroidales bacterium]|nr:hypothetical protein [Bacteroidales bacterium]
MVKRIAFVFFLLFYANLLIGQENPHPFVRNFLPVEYGGETQSWALEQDTLGSIYLGGNTGIHVFNGTQWSKIEFPTEDVCRSLKKAKNGRVYAGTVGDFGYININNNGELVYESLIYLLDSADKVFTDVWSIKTHENKVYFHTNQSIYIYNYEEPIDSLKISILDTDIFVIAEVNGNILVEVKDGFFKIQGDSLVSIDKKIYPWIMLPMSAKHTFILDSEAKRARVFNDNEWIDVSTEYFTNKKATEIYTQLVEEQCYSSLVWKDSLLIFGTLSSGILVMDKAGNFIETINEDFGLENSSIMTLFIDNREQIWAGTSNGLSYIEYNSPIKKWNKNDGIVGAIYGVSRLENKLHVYTNLGIYQLDGQKFEPIPELS